MKKDPESLSALLMEAFDEVDAFLQGKTQLSATVVEIPNRELKSKEIARIRKNLGMPVEKFAETMNVNPATVRRWEKGLQRPKGPAIRLLQFLNSNPNLIIDSTKTRRTEIQQAR